MTAGGRLPPYSEGRAHWHATDPLTTQPPTQQENQMATSNHKGGTAAPTPSDGGPLTLDDPKLREALEALTDCRDEAVRIARGLWATIDALEDDIAAIDRKKHPKAWGLMDATSSGIQLLQMNLEKVDAACWFVQSKVLQCGRQ